MDDICFFRMPDRTGVDYCGHNAEVRALHAAFAENRHERVPIRLNTNPRMLLLDPGYHGSPPSYREYMTDSDAMGQCILEWQYWVRFLLPGDHEKGLPDAWPVHVDFQNIYDAAWFGGPVVFKGDQIPYAEPCLGEDNKRLLFDRGIPDPFKGEWPERAEQFLDCFRKKRDRGWTFLGRPVEPTPTAPFINTDGPFTAAASLRGPTGICTDMMMDPDYVHELLDFLTDALIARIRAWRQFLELPPVAEEWGTADDSVEMLSVEQYREFVLPRHRRIFDAFCPQGKRAIHLCGNAQRLFPVICRDLRVTSFDTGFPVDFRRFREEMGPEVLLSGGPRAPLFVETDSGPLLEETARILNSGILEGGRFILQEGNNLPPCAPLGHCTAFYDRGRALGRIPGRQRPTPD